jgi:3-oxoacyl-[acyl-carrier-protein] synthase II
LGIGPTWEAARAGRSAIGPIDAFNPGGFDCRIGAQVRDFAVRDFVPKSYRKATKVMAADIEFAVAAADLAARDAGLRTAGTDSEAAGSPDFRPTYDSSRVGCQIGAGLIAAEVNELSQALHEARDESGAFSIHKWGREGITHLTPLWLLKYLPNMLACHVTIIHDAQGPSNTITCAEASAMLSIGESLRVIQRGSADMCFCGGAEDKLNPMAFLRQIFTGRLNTTSNDNPAAAVRPFDKNAAGMVIGQGGAIVVLESWDTFEMRREAASGTGSPRAYAEVAGFGASQSVHIPGRNLSPDPNGRGVALAIRAAMREAKVTPEQIDLIIPFGVGIPDCDAAEAAALFSVFGPRIGAIPVVSTKPLVGNCYSGGGGIDVCFAAKAIAEQTIPAAINCDEPIGGVNAGSQPSRSAKLDYVLTYSAGFGGQNAALVLGRLS